jgi:hypothetical protein
VLTYLAQERQDAFDRIHQIENTDLPNAQQAVEDAYAAATTGNSLEVITFKEAQRRVNLLNALSEKLESVKRQYYEGDPQKHDALKNAAQGAFGSGNLTIIGNFFDDLKKGVQDECDIILPTVQDLKNALGVLRNYGTKQMLRLDVKLFDCVRNDIHEAKSVNSALAAVVVDVEKLLNNINDSMDGGVFVCFEELGKTRRYFDLADKIIKQYTTDPTTARMLNFLLTS